MPGPSSSSLIIGGANQTAAGFIKYLTREYCVCVPNAEMALKTQNQMYPTLVGWMVSGQGKNCRTFLLFPGLKERKG